ncbi:DNA topoisomerase I [Fistulifera solaris]|uniref:DNA topoisomerase 1 n=1 Tax=Fistulifera solaris TaxID=1519565 RepID=A0A1Z5KFS1_FISSO|nr:DNA topoisomerase I [Fistulifera solaris]|eukprot:GAX25056.1 DNA topoisomerase I [Fistulifera solaris]
MSSTDEEEFDMDNEVLPKKKKNGNDEAVPKKKKKRPVKDEEDGEMHDDDEDYDDDVPLKQLKNKKKNKEKESKKRKPDKVVSGPVKKKKKTEDVKPDKPKSDDTAMKKTAIKALKKLDKAERLQYAMQSFLWWDSVEPPEGCQWRTMEHSGVSFPEEYVPHGIKMKYDGKDVDLTPAQEEAATFFAAMDPEGMHLGDPKTAKIFIKNYFADFLEVLGKKHIIKDFKKCDFEPIRRHLNEQKIIKKAITDEQRKANKDDRNQVMFRFGYAIVDGHIEKVGNYNMEPPGTFRGRGEHPKMGKLKQRVAPEQVSLNLSQCAAVPRCSVPGHAWGDIKHDPRGQWLATWKENINNQSKYMQLAAQSSFKGKSDRSKYNKAALLCSNIEKIRKSYKKDLKSKDQETKQLATAVWVIDRLALRVGGEKDTDEEADTVGCCSLRVEHLEFDPNGEGGVNREIKLEFLGKDSMLYKQTIDFGATMYNENNGMGEQVYENFKSFCKKKKPDQEVFDSINPTLLNQHLKTFMDGLSAKVFRTYNASKTLQDELRKHEAGSQWKNLTATEKVVEYNNANREVAILCNHQRSVSKAQETALEAIGSKLATLKKQKKDLKQMLKKLNSGDSSGLPVRKSFEEMAEDVQKAVEKAKKMKEAAKTNEEKIAATQADEKAKQKKRDLADKKFQKAHLWEKVPTKDQLVKRIEAWTAKINKMEMDLKHKDDNKEVSLGTSKINYMDPRISVAFCKRNEVPIEKIFSKTLRDKFNWAMAVQPDWEFNEKVALEG